MRISVGFPYVSLKLRPRTKWNSMWRTVFTLHLINTKNKRDRYIVLDIPILITSYCLWRGLGFQSMIIRRRDKKHRWRDKKHIVSCYLRNGSNYYFSAGRSTRSSCAHIVHHVRPSIISSRNYYTMLLYFSLDCIW